MSFSVARRARLLARTVRGGLYDLPAPANIGYFWSFGRALGLFYLVQLVRGISLRFFYASSGAFDVRLYLARDVNWGWLMRSIHANGASLFLGLAYLHIARGLYFGSFARLAHVWLRGRILLVCMMAAAFLGYVLPWGQMRYWGATVITNLLGVIPFIGPSLVELLWGGFTVGPATLTRFYSLHYMVPLLIAPLVLAHLELLHTTGSRRPLGGLPHRRLPFHPYSSSLDLVSAWTFIGIFALVVLGAPHALGRPDNFELANPLKTPAHIMPEWYFLPFYTILRAVPQKTGGVVAMAAAILALFWLPRLRGGRSTPILLLWGFFLNFAVLGWLGACPMEAPFPVLGAANASLYFIWFLVLWVFRGTSVSYSNGIGIFFISLWAGIIAGSR